MKTRSAKTDSLTVGNGAKFWAYISPQNNTPKNVTKWSVTIEQSNGNWKGTITSANPHEQLQTPGLSGIFHVAVTASGPHMPEHQLQPQPPSTHEIGCNANCASMLGVVSDPNGSNAHFWTAWDAFCLPTH